MALFSKFPIKSIDDLKGRKIGASGAAGNWVRGTGAVVVNSALSEAFTSIKNKLYVGYAAPNELAFPFKVYRAAPHMTRVNFGAVVGSGLTINSKTFAKLPDHAKAIFRDVAAEWGVQYGLQSRALSQKFEGIMVKQGLKVSEISRKERVRWARSLKNTAKAWADGLDKKGLPGNQLLSHFMNAQRAAGYKPLRDWDRN